MKWCFLLCFFMYSFNTSIAQEASRDTTSTKSAYIASFRDRFNLRIGLNNLFNSFSVNDSQNNIEYLISPNQELRMRFSISLKILDISFGFKPSFIGFNNDDDELGSSDIFTLNLNLYFGQWVQTIGIFNTKGFFAEFSNSLVGFGNSDEVILLPDLRIEKYGGVTSYVFNENFSMRALTTQKEKQLKSAGSFIPRFSYFYTYIRGFGDLGDQKGHLWDFVLSPSYQYNWVFGKNFLVSVGGLIGGGVNISNTTVIEEGLTTKESTTNFDFTYGANAELGYHSNSFFAGAVGTLHVFEHKVDRFLRFQDVQGFFEVYAGYRFKAPKKWRDKLDDIENDLEKDIGL